MKTIKIIAISIIALSLQACASHDAARGARGTGQKEIYAASYDRTWDASISAVETTGGKIVESNKEKGDILASYGVTAFSWGERVAVFLKSIGTKQTEVEVATKRAVATNITAKNWDAKLHGTIGKNLASE